MFRFFLSLLFGFASSIALAADDTNYPKLDFHSLYQKVESPPFPVEYVFTDGANEPAFEPWGVPKFYVADLNNDQCDDIFFDWADSAAEPFVFLVTNLDNSQNQTFLQDTQKSGQSEKQTLPTSIMTGT